MEQRPHRPKTLGWISSMSLVSLCIFSQSCGGTLGFIRGKYDDPTRVELLDDKYNEADMQSMAEAVVKGFSACPALLKAVEPPVVIVEKIKNSTQEHIDTQSLTDKMRTALIHAGVLRFVNQEARDKIQKEYEYHAAGNISHATAKKPGSQIGADYIMSGVLATNIQEAGNQKYIYYKLTVNLTHLTQSTIDCSEEKEIRKAYSKHRVGF